MIIFPNQILDPVILKLLRFRSKDLLSKTENESSDEEWKIEKEAIEADKVEQRGYEATKIIIDKTAFNRYKYMRKQTNKNKDKDECGNCQNVSRLNKINRQIQIHLSAIEQANQWELTIKKQYYIWQGVKSCFEQHICPYSKECRVRPKPNSNLEDQIALILFLRENISPL